MLVRSSCSFGWSADHPCRFLIRGRSFSDNNAAASPLLSEFTFTANERFLYDVRFRDAQALMPVWQHQVGLETILTAGPSDSFTRCIEGRGSPPLEQASGPVELALLAELLTPRSLVHRLAELIDGNFVDCRIAQELRHLRPWLNLRTGIQGSEEFMRAHC
ncbi:MAG: plasmid pRiA4b ORF-3 family protein [Nitrospira sp.]|nr:plasmid pRiA4b ORF-3 family protein [Nitrospira sp.]MDH5726676.1 plasmid pRiA4b ORF-3 family protein [Nitrospira sp.]